MTSYNLVRCRWLLWIVVDGARGTGETGEELRRKGGHGGVNSVNTRYLVPQFLWIESIFARHRCVNEVDRLAVPAPNINLLRASTITTRTTRPEGSRVTLLLASRVRAHTRLCGPYTCRWGHIVLYAPLNTSSVWRLALYEAFFDLRFWNTSFVVLTPRYCRYNPFLRANFARRLIIIFVIILIIDDEFLFLCIFHDENERK